MSLMDGKSVANAVNERTAELVQTLVTEHGVTPGLAVVLVGEDPASAVYVNSKAKTANKLGLHSEKHVLPVSATQDEVLALVRQLNADKNVHGILVQSPPPPGINEREINDTIDPAKDVDCFHPQNVGCLLIGDENTFYPCTPYGIMVLLKHYDIDPAGKRAVVVGRSNLVGKPIAVLLGRKQRGANATVTLCHSGTSDLAECCREADILIVAIGRDRFITADMIKPGAVVIDVGMNRVDDPTKKRGYRLTGDVDDSDAVRDKASYLTPVPGGVGPMTVAMLMRNAVWACCNQLQVDLDTRAF
jgi:methylenetetrahydrofolate dehydrogenase (NADP+)/methenyltetrahydrofolate cyclohydrolase